MVCNQVADDIHFPNGMVVTPDNRTLIVAESFASRLTAFDIAADGSLRMMGTEPRLRTPDPTSTARPIPCRAHT